MLWIGFQVGEERYAVRGRDLVEVIPRVVLRSVPFAPACVAGLFTYRSRATPVIDLGVLLHSRPSCERLSSRILIVALAHGEQVRNVGLLAEKVTDVRLEQTRPQAALALEDAPFLGEVLLRGSEIVHRVEPAKLVSGELWSVLFPPEPAA